MASDWKDALGGLIGKTPEEVARTQRQPAGQKASSGKEPPAFFSRDDYVDLADQCMQRLGRPSKNKWNKENEIKRNYGELTSSQMRNLFALVTRSGLLRGLDFIGTDKGRFLRYARYMEALVAYHYYYTDKKD